MQWAHVTQTMACSHWLSESHNGIGGRAALDTQNWKTPVCNANGCDTVTADFINLMRNWRHTSTNNETIKLEC